MVRLLVSPAIVGVLCCAMVPAAAARTGDIGSEMTVTGELRGVTRRQTVSLRDLDLRRDAHVVRAESRLRFASKQVCDTSATQDLYQKRDYGLCFGPALSGARNDLDRHVALARGN